MFVGSSTDAGPLRPFKATKGAKQARPPTRAHKPPDGQPGPENHPHTTNPPTRKTPNPDMSTIGIDPGARNTGIVAIHDDGTIHGHTIHNDGPLLPVPRTYLRDILNTVADLLANLGPDTTIRVEGVTRPNWHVAKAAGGGSASNPEALLGTAMTLGAITGHYQCDTIPPGKHGSKPLGTYPNQLVSDGERRREGWEQRVGTGKLRHQRSAWDIAHYTPPTTPRPRGPKPADIHITDYQEGRTRR